MKTNYNQSDVGRKARWLHPLIKPLLTMIMLLTMGMSLMAQHTMIGSSFCYNGTNTTTMGLDGGTPTMYHVLVHFRPDGTIVEKTLVLPTTTDPFNFVVNYGTVDGSQGLYVTYVYTQAQYLSLISGYPGNLLLDLAKVQTGIRQGGEVWIYSTPTVYTLNPYGTSYTSSSGAYIFCDGTAGVTLEDSELSNYAYLETAGVILNDNWEVNYQLYKDAIAEGSTVLGTGNPIDWTGLEAAPNTYTVKATRVGGCAVTDMNGSVIVNDQATVKNINTNLCFLSIQEAIDDASTMDGHTLWCLIEQTYSEDIDIDKELTLMPDPGLTGDVDIDGSIDIHADNVTVTNFFGVLSSGTYAFKVFSPYGNYDINNIGMISSFGFDGVFVEGGAGGGAISDNQFPLNQTGINIDGSLTGILTIDGNDFNGDTPPTTEIGILNAADGVIIQNNTFNDLLTGISNSGDNVDILGNSIPNIDPAGTAVLNTGTGVQVSDNDFSQITTTAINSTVALDGVSNWYGDPTGPTIASNPCGLGSAIVGALVVYSPWWYDAAMTTLNGLPVVGLTAIPDMSTITKTPLIIKVTSTFPSDLEDYNSDVKSDARISASPAFTPGTEITDLKITVNGTPYPIPGMTLPFDLNGKTEFYLSEVLNHVFSLRSQDGETIDWEITVTGPDAPSSHDVTFDVVSYITTKTNCNNLLGTEEFNNAYDDAILTTTASPVEVCTTVANPEFDVDITYPAIVNVDSEVKTDALITSSVMIPAGTEILWSYESGAASGSYLVTTPLDEILLSTIVGVSPATLQGHTGTAHWSFEIVNLPVGSYDLTIDALAVLGTTNYVFETADLTLEVYPLPTATLSVVGSNHICTGGDATFKVDFTGTGPWTFTYTDGTTPVTVPPTMDNPYYFSIMHTSNKTWTISNVTDAHCSNVGTGTVKIYIGTVTYVGVSSPLHPCEGSYVEIPITVDNFDDVGALSLTLNYNDDALEFESFTQNSSLIDFFFNVLGSTPNTIKIGGYSNVSNYLPNGSVLCTLRFLYKGGVSNLHWDIINPDACEYYSLDYGIFCDIPSNLYYIDAVSPLEGYLRPKAHVSENDVICSGESTTFKVDLIGVQPWTFTYNDGTADHTVGPITATPYYVTVTPTATTTYTPVGVTDVNGCAFELGDLTGSATITVNELPVLSFTKINETCFEAEDGSINLTVTGTPDYTYIWSNLATTQDISGLAPNTYAVTVTDFNGCKKSGSEVILPAVQLNADVTPTDVTCYGGSDGQISITNPSGGWRGFEYMITGSGWQSSGLFTGLTEGAYNVYIRDDSVPSCQRTLEVELGINQPEVLSAAVAKTDVTCNGAGDGTITVSDPMGGHGNWDVSIDGLTWSVVSTITPVVFQNLTPGTYTVLIHDAGYTACEINLGQQTIAEPDALAGTVSSTNITCFGANDGTITINGATGGWGAIEFSIDGGGSWQSSNEFTGLAPTVTDHHVIMRSVLFHDCDLDLGFVAITEPAILSAAVSSTVMSCHDANDATITVSSPDGGYGTYEVSINGSDWFTLVSSYTFYNLSSGYYTVEIRDAAKTGCVITLDVVHVENPVIIDLAGNISYLNLPGTVLSGVTVDLMVGSTVVKTGTTDTFGNYHIANVCPDNYEIHVSYDVVLSAEKDPVNVTDAAQVSQWSVCIPMPATCDIEKVKFYAGDVIMNNRFTNTDATQIWNYFLTSGLQTWVGRDRWTFWPTNQTIPENPLTEDPILAYPSITIAHGTPLYTQNFYALYTGDFNGSFTGFGTKSADLNVRLDVANTMMVEPGTEFELPVMASASMDVRAISLLLNFPSDKLEIVGAYLSNTPENPVLYNLMGDELRLGWTASTPLNLNAGDRLLTLKLKLTTALAKDERIQLTLTGSPLNELADGNVEVISNAVLHAAQIGSSATGVIENNASAGLSLTNYPNPFNETTTFAFTLPYDGVVTLDVYDMLGNKVNVLLNETMTAGNHKLTINSNTLKPGVYTATMGLNKDGQLLKRTIKIVRNQ